jgi:hypothetical protein
LVHATARVELALVQLRLAPGAGDAQDRQRSERIELCEDERRLEIAPGIVHPWSIVPDLSMRPSVSTSL